MNAHPNNHQVRIALLSGSGRRNSTNLAALRSAAQDAPPYVKAALVEGIGELPLFNPDDDQEGADIDERVQAVRRQITRADALLICTPEYAGALPAVLKNVLEWTVGDASTYGKPVAWINVSGVASPSGGADAHESLGKVLGYVGAEIITEACARVPLSRAMLDGEGSLVDADARAAIAEAIGRLAQVTRRSQRPEAERRAALTAAPRAGSCAGC